jgi:hypothetical protein
MIRTGRQIHWRKLRHRVVAGLSIVSYLAAAIGYPLPAASAVRREFSEPFPCQGHACGCRSAEECWSGCCCLSPEERWSWARAHHVQPPEYAEKPLRQDNRAGTGWRTVRLRDLAEPDCSAPASCCEHKCSRPDSCCSEREAVATRASSCCNRPARDRKVDESTVTSDCRTKGRCLLAVSALRCKGLTMLWVQSGVVVSPSAPQALADGLLPEQPNLRDGIPVQIVQTPPAPPPRSLPA